MARAVVVWRLTTLAYVAVTKVLNCLSSIGDDLIMHQNVATDNQGFFLNCSLMEINCLDSIAIRIVDINRKIRMTPNNHYLKKVRQRLYERRHYLKKVRIGFEPQDVKVLDKELKLQAATEKKNLKSYEIESGQDLARLARHLEVEQESCKINMDSSKILQDVKVLGKDLARRTLTEKQDLAVDKMQAKQDLEIGKTRKQQDKILQDPRQDVNTQDREDRLPKARSWVLQDYDDPRSCKTQDKILDQDLARSEVGVEQDLASTWRQDLARQVGILFRSLFLIACTAGLGWFVILQTLPLYKSLSFDLPYESAIGALVLAVGFAGLHAACPRGRTRIYCFGVCLYEIGLVGAGTFAYEQDLVAQKILQDSKSKILQESLMAAETSYSHAKKRYSDPQDKMHKNGWYFQNYVLPNLNKLEDVQHRLDDYRSSFETPLQKSAGYLKLLYRVLLVILLMTFTHHTIIAILNCFKRQDALP